MILGSHVSFAKDQLLGSAKECVSYNANTFMFYTGAPQNTIRKSIDKSITLKALEYMKEHDIDINNVICHAPYIINLANKTDPLKWQFSINFLEQELKRCDEIGIKSIVIHPGSALKEDKKIALTNIVDALNIILDKGYNCQILLETMAGKGSECGSTLEEILFIYVNTFKRVKVCLDTCHLHDSGVSMEKFDEYLEDFDKLIGLENIGCIHINDSKNPLSSHKDRHANIGYGTIGFDNIINIIYHEKLKNIPKILETPYVGDSWNDKEKKYPPYRFEIESIKNKEFDSLLLEHIKNYYNK